MSNSPHGLTSKVPTLSGRRGFSGFPLTLANLETHLPWYHSVGNSEVVAARTREFPFGFGREADKFGLSLCGGRPNCSTPEGLRPAASIAAPSGLEIADSILMFS